MPIPLSPSPEEGQRMLSGGGGFSYQPIWIVPEQPKPQPTRREPRGIEDVYGTREQYGVLSWEKDVPSVIYGPPIEAPRYRMWRESPGYSPYQKEVERRFLGHEAWIQSTPQGRLSKAIGATEYLGLYIAPMAKNYFASGLISAGISEGYSRFIKGVDISFDEATRSFAFGAASAFGATQVLKGVSWAAKIIAPEQTAALTRAVKFGRPAQFLHQTKLAFMERIPFWKITQPFTKRIAVGEMAIPTFERYGLSELGLEDVAWKSMLTPRMGGVMYAQYPELTKGILQKWGFDLIVSGGVATKVFRPFREEELFRRTLPEVNISKVSSVSGYARFSSLSKETLAKMRWDWFKYANRDFWFWRELPSEVRFTPLVSQSQVTRIGLQPYIPRITRGFLGKQGSMSAFLGVPTITLTQPQRLQPKKIYPFYPTLTFQPEKFRSQTLLSPLPQRKERKMPSVLFPGMREFQEQGQNIIQVPSFTPKEEAGQIQIPSLTLKQTQRQTQGIAQLFMPQKTVTPSKFFPKWPLGGGDSGGKGGGGSLFGKWFKKQQRIKTPQQMLETFFGSRRKRK